MSCYWGRGNGKPICIYKVIGQRGKLKGLEIWFSWRLWWKLRCSASLGRCKQLRNDNSVLTQILVLRYNSIPCFYFNIPLPIFEQKKFVSDEIVFFRFSCSPVNLRLKSNMLRRQRNTANNAYRASPHFQTYYRLLNVENQQKRNVEFRCNFGWKRYKMSVLFTFIATWKLLTL